MLLRAANLAVSYGEKTILNHIDLTLYPNERVGLIGANGVGKSTLLRVLAGEHTPDTGTIDLADGVDLGYLPQDVPALSGRTVQNLLDDALAHVHALRDQLRDLETQMAQPDADLEAVFADYDRVTEAFDRAGGYEADARVEEVLAGLQVDQILRGRDLATLSGGERSRLSLAAMLSRAPDVLLLDEPTNHIDAATLGWLEATLAAYRGAVLLVSHDRVFLNATVNRIIEIDNHTREAVGYGGNYDAYAEVKAAQLNRWREDYADQQAEIKQLQSVLKAKRASASGKRSIKISDNDKIIKYGKGQTADRTLSRDIGSVETRLERIQEDPIPRPPKPLVISPEMDTTALYGEGFPVIVSNLCKHYGDRTILDGVSFTVGAGERVAITGPNGAGKSTLLKIIAGEVTPDSGGVTLAGAVRIGYLPQTDDLPPGDTLIEAYGYGLDGDYEDHKADLISSGLFRYPELDAPVSGLSAGQRRKVQLARLSISGANVLLLDEPTNHLSFDVLEGFEAALADFPGVIIAVSHDRRFLEQFGGREVQLSLTI